MISIHQRQNDVDFFGRRNLQVRKPALVSKLRRRVGNGVT